MKFMIGRGSNRGDIARAAENPIKLISESGVSGSAPIFMNDFILSIGSAGDVIVAKDKMQISGKICTKRIYIGKVDPNLLRM